MIESAQSASNEMTTDKPTGGAAHSPSPTFSITGAFARGSPVGPERGDARRAVLHVLARRGLYLRSSVLGTPLDLLTRSCSAWLRGAGAAVSPCAHYPCMWARHASPRAAVRARRIW